MKDFVRDLKNSGIQNFIKLDKISKGIIQPINEITSIKKDNDNVLVINFNDKKFEHWLSQKQLISPWETHWYQLKDKEYLTLEKGLLQKLINLGGHKAGNLNKLRKILKVSQLFVYYGVKGKTETITVKNLRKLLSYLNIPYDELNNKIIEIRKGKKASIKNPKFPINLLTPESASIIGALVSDGCISIDRKARMTKRVKYCTNNLEDIELFTKNIQKIFGNVLISSEKVRNSTVVRIGTSIVADSFLRVGCILGKKSVKDRGIPWIIKEANSELKKRYLSTVFSDEGSVGKLHKPYIILSRAKHLNNILADEDLKTLDRCIESNMETHKIRSHYIKKISIRKFIKIVKDSNKSSASDMVTQILRVGIPKLLLDESNLLKEFEIENKIYIIKLSKTFNGTYSLTSSLVIRKKESLLRFYKEIGFQSSDKQNKLEKYLKKVGWL